MKRRGVRLQAIYDKMDGHCAYCGDRISPLGRWQVDHMIPLQQGGTDDISNLVPACGGCNRAKGNRTVDEYREMLREKWLSGLCIVQDAFFRIPIPTRKDRDFRPIEQRVCEAMDLLEVLDPSRLTFYTELEGDKE
jgi:hypothetical protein